MDASKPEPMPTLNAGPPIADQVVEQLNFMHWSEGPEDTQVRAQVIEDLLARKAVGIKTYGTPLQAFNGRNALMDLYQEVLDACQYATQVEVEESAGRPDTYCSSITPVLLDLLKMSVEIRKLLNDKLSAAPRSTSVSPT